MEDVKEIQDLVRSGQFDAALARAAPLPDPSRGDLFERIADRLARESLGPALWAYEQALAAYADYASYATSGGEGAARMLDVERVRTKIERAVADPGRDPALAALEVRVQGKKYDLDSVRELETRLAGLTETPDDLLQTGLDALAFHVSTPLSWLLIEYFKAAGPRHANYERAVFHRFTQESYSKLCANHPVEAAEPPKPSSWSEWARTGWVPCQEDWPLTELVFALDSRAKVNAILSRPRGGLAPSHETIQYFLLLRLSASPEPDLDRIHALAGLVAAAASPHRKLLRDRAALVFRDYWRALPLASLEPVAARASEWIERRKASFE